MSIRTKIVVGVDGSAGALTAVRYATAEAARTGLPLELVFVLPEPSAVAASMDRRLYPLSIAEMKHAARQILDQAAAHAAETHELAHPPHLTLAQGDPASVLRKHAQRGSLVVLGNDRRPLVERLVTGSLLNAVAGSSEGSVIVVPDDWSADQRHHRVAVGIALLDQSMGLLWRAFRAAAERDATLAILHAWELRIRYGQVRVNTTDLETWQRDIEGALRSDIDACAADFPAVKYHVVARNQQPAFALTEATTTADLMLIARRPHLGGRNHLGSTGRALLQAAHCPVEVVPPAGEPVWERDAELERGGALLASRG